MQALGHKLTKQELYFKVLSRKMDPLTRASNSLSKITKDIEMVESFKQPLIVNLDDEPTQLAQQGSCQEECP